VHARLNVSGCSFYSSQGRRDPNFEDGWLPHLHARHPTSSIPIIAAAAAAAAA
jgi:hypothetical protein